MTVQENQVDTVTPDGVADGYFYTPAESGTWPGIVLYTDVLGVRPAYREMAKRLAAEGFAVLLPNFYYRISPLPVFASPPKFGDEVTQARIADLRPKASPVLFTRDASSYIAALDRQPQVEGKLGAVGYCMGGAMALRSVVAASGKVAAAVSFHGTLATDASDSPHLLAPALQARLYLGYAADDKSMPPEAIAKLEHALKAADARYESEIYANTRHGWCIPDHTVYHPVQAEHAWAKMVAFFKAALT